MAEADDEITQPKEQIGQLSKRFKLEQEANQQLSLSKSIRIDQLTREVDELKTENRNLKNSNSQFKRCGNKETKHGELHAINKTSENLAPVDNSK